jgi:hypothetical protein
LQKQASAVFSYFKSEASALMITVAGKVCADMCGITVSFGLGGWPEGLSMREATGLLEQMELHPGYHYHTCAANWRALTKPFFRRLHGHKQVTDAYLLGMAIEDDLILATFDKRIAHLAGEHVQQVLILG